MRAYDLATTTSHPYATGRTPSGRWSVVAGWPSVPGGHCATDRCQSRGCEYLGQAAPAQLGWSPKFAEQTSAGTSAAPDHRPMAAPAGGIEPGSPAGRFWDGALVQAWLTHDWPRIKKRLVIEVRKSSSSMRPGVRFAPRQVPPGLQRGRHPCCGAWV